MSDASRDGLFVGVELGGTKIVVATGAGGPSISKRETIPTADPESTLAEVRTVIEDMTGDEQIRGLGLATFGPVDLRRKSPTYGELLTTPKPGWTGVNVVDELRLHTGIPVGLDTDVNGAVLAEKHWGAGVEFDHVAYITVGTGVGGGIWSGGRIVHGANHAEIGHIRVPRQAEDHHASTCPFHPDCLEGMASGTAVRERWGMPAQELDHLTASATRLEAWYLARGIAGLCAIIPVDAVIIGGGIAKLPNLHAEITKALGEASGLYPPVPFADGGPAVVPPMLGDDAGVVGAIELAKRAADVPRSGSARTPG